MRVLGVDRTTRVTQFVVEVANHGDVPIKSIRPTFFG